MKTRFVEVPLDCSVITVMPDHSIRLDKPVDLNLDAEDIDKVPEHFIQASMIVAFANSEVGIKAITQWFFDHIGADEEDEDEEDDTDPAGV